MKLQTRRLALLAVAVMATACTTEEIAEPIDDGSTLAEQTEPEPELYGPDNTWSHALQQDVPAELAGTGFYVGDVANNFTFIDQHGDEVELYQFYGKTVLLDVFAEWCGPCNDHAPTGEDMWQEVVDRDIVIIAMMQEVNSGASPEGAEDAARWADAHGLTHPVLSDSTGAAGEFASIGGGYPTYPLIGPDMKIIYQDVYPPSIDLLTDVLESERIW